MPSPEQDKVLQLLFRPHKGVTEKERKLENFLDRLLMRLYTSTSLIAYLYDAQVVGGNIELAFNDLPPEIVPKVISITGVADVKPFEFRSDDNNHIYTGFRFTPEEQYLEEL